jgi:hypothetical protein
MVDPWGWEVRSLVRRTCEEDTLEEDQEGHPECDETNQQTTTTPSARHHHRAQR